MSGVLHWPFRCSVQIAASTWAGVKTLHRAWLAVGGVAAFGVGGWGGCLVSRAWLVAKHAWKRRMQRV
jgi:hypothetical protein